MNRHRNENSGAGLAGATASAAFSANSAACHVVRKRNAAQIDIVIAFDMVEDQSELTEIPVFQNCVRA